MSKHDPPEELTAEELEAQSAAVLPDREAMSTLDPTGGLGLGGTDVLDIDVNLDLEADAAAPISAAMPADADVGDQDSLIEHNDREADDG